MNGTLPYPENAIRCDGCGMTIPYKQVPSCLFMAFGVQIRYCTDCAAEWRALETVVNAEVARCQRLADLFALDARQKSPLKLTPFDFPKIACDAAGNPVVLR